MDGLETDVDCGGDECPPCGEMELCEIDADCESQSCDAGACAPIDCDDGIKNGSETDLDCGGECDPCTEGAACIHHSDCETEVCDGECLPADCMDRVTNGAETGVDCGGPVCSPCGYLEGCDNGGDCLTGTCLYGLCDSG